MNRPTLKKAESDSENGFPLTAPNISPAASERLKDRASVEDRETVYADELEKQVGDALEETDSNFKSELDYDGYRTIEESDNNAYESLDLERKGQSGSDLEIEGREEGDIDSGEESLIDPQENRK